MSRFPICRACPSCGSPDYNKEQPEGTVAFVKDRVCKACLTRYTPPTPVWAAIVFIVVGSILALGAGLNLLALLVDLLTEPRAMGAPIFLLFSAVFAFAGVASVIFGMRSFWQKVQEPPEWHAAP